MGIHRFACATADRRGMVNSGSLSSLLLASATAEHRETLIGWLLGRQWLEKICCKVTSLCRFPSDGQMEAQGTVDKFWFLRENFSNFAVSIVNMKQMLMMYKYLKNSSRWQALQQNFWRTAHTLQCASEVVVKLFVVQVLHGSDSTEHVEHSILGSHCCKVCYLFHFYKYLLGYGIKNHWYVWYGKITIYLLRNQISVLVVWASICPLGGNRQGDVTLQQN